MQERLRERFTLHQKSPILVDGRMKLFDSSLSDLRALSSFAISFAFGDKKAQEGSNIFWSLISSMHWVFKLRIIHLCCSENWEKKKFQVLVTKKLIIHKPDLLLIGPLYSLNCLDKHNPHGNYLWLSEIESNKQQQRRKKISWVKTWKTKYSLTHLYIHYFTQIFTIYKLMYKF